MRKKLIKTSCVVAAVVFFASACMLDSMTWVPFVLCLVSLAWLLLVAHANIEWKGEDKDAEQANARNIQSQAGDGDSESA